MSKAPTRRNTIISHPGGAIRMSRTISRLASGPILCGIVLASFSTARAQQPTGSPAAQVCGRVVKVTCDSKKLNATVLELKPNSSRLPLTIETADRKAFSPSPEELFRGAEICAAGATEVRDGRARMILRAPGEVTIRQPPARPAQPWMTPGFRECDEGLEMPTVASEWKPGYPRAAMQARLQGVVGMEALVRPDGTVGEVHVTQSLDERTGLDREAIESLKRWRFKPGLKSGQPVPVIVEVEMSFTLK